MSFMMLEATELGVGNCWVQMHLRKSLTGKDAEENVRKILGIEDDSMRIVGILSLGIPAAVAAAHTVEDADRTKVHLLD